MTHTAPLFQPRRGAILAAGLLLLGTTAACRGTEEAAGEQPAAAPMMVGVENIAVARQTALASGPVVSGSLTPDREATIAAEVGGSVLAVYAEEGQRVGSGTLLARIDDTAIQAQLLSARSAVASARAQAQNAERELARARTLVQAGAIAERDAESAQAAHEAAQAQLAGARAQLAVAEQQLGRTRVTAPFDGVVSRRPVNTGDVVTPGTPLYQIVAPGSMRLDASVPAAQLGDVRLGAPVTFSVAGYPDRTFAGRVTRINPVADPQTRQVRIQIAIPNAEGTLVGGLFAEGRVASAEREGVVVPESAVDQRGVTPQVFRLRAGTVERVEVQLGLRDEQAERVELLAGVAAGDTLLLGAAQGISPGTAVRVSQPNDTAPGTAPATIAPTSTAAATPGR